MTMHSTDKIDRDRGAGLAEYAILLLFVTMACIAVLTTLGVTINGMLTQVVDKF